MKRNILLPLLASAAAALAACSSETGYDKAFSEKAALAGNSHACDASVDQTFRAVKLTLIQHGFTIESADLATGLIKGSRSLQDPKKKKYAYLITGSVYVTGAPVGDGAVITASANQQTVLHKESEKYYHLLGLVPIPTGRDYQTVVTKEGNIDDKAFYAEFFADVEKNLRIAAVQAATRPTPVVATPLVDPGIGSGSPSPSPAAAPAPAAEIPPGTANPAAAGAQPPTAPAPGS